MLLRSLNAALDLISKSSKLLDSVREQAKTSRDAALKENISKLYDDFLDLKAVILRLTEEVNALRAAQTRKPLVFRAPFYYRENDKIPFCPACYQVKDSTEVHLTKNELGWYCTVCKNTFYSDGDDPNVPAFGVV